MFFFFSFSFFIILKNKCNLIILIFQNKNVIIIYTEKFIIRKILEKY